MNFDWTLGSFNPLVAISFVVAMVMIVFGVPYCFISDIKNWSKKKDDDAT